MNEQQLFTLKGKIHHKKGIMFCSECSKGFYVNAQLLIKYFKMVPNFCPHCKKALDLWAITLRSLGRFLFESLALVGAVHTSFILAIYPPEQFGSNQKNMIRIKFNDFEIPSNARILDVSTTINMPGSENDGYLSLFAAQGNSPYRHYKIYPEMIWYPYPQGNPPYLPTDISFSITWIEAAEENEEAWESLADALHAFWQWHTKHAIIPANVAVELELTRLLSTFFEQNKISTKKLKPFLQEKATYSAQLNILLPTLMNMINAPILPSKILGQLNRLRDLRNAIGHRSKTEKPLDRREVALCLCAAIFGFHYINFIAGPLLVGKYRRDYPQINDEDTPIIGNS